MTSLGSIPAEQRWRDTMRSMGCHVTPASVAGIPRVDEDGFFDNKVRRSCENGGRQHSGDPGELYASPWGKIAI